MQSKEIFVRTVISFYGVNVRSVYSWLKSGKLVWDPNQPFKVPVKEGHVAVPILTAARYHQVSRRTIYNWLEQGKVDFFRTPSGSRRIWIPNVLTENNPESLDRRTN